MLRVICFFLGLALAAQDNSLLTVLRGDLLEWESTGPGGELSVRTADHSVQRCRFDPQTYFEQKQQRVTPSTALIGQLVELIADRNGGPTRCYARAVRVVADAAPSVRRPPLTRVPLAGSSTGLYTSSIADLLAPRGNLTFAGIVLRMNPEFVTLRTRTDGQKEIRLRQDTRYVHEGAPVSSAQLLVNTRVFIRAGKNLDGELEAFQVVWGEILSPK